MSVLRVRGGLVTDLNVSFDTVQTLFAGDVPHGQDGGEGRGQDHQLDRLQDNQVGRLLLFRVTVAGQQLTSERNDCTTISQYKFDVSRNMCN